MIELTNPSNLPDPSEIEYMEEPVVAAEIMVTSEYIGAIMDLCQERRGIYEGMEYMEATRALLRYTLPLNEIIYDFFDALKSRSRGYASFDYEMKGYQRSELVKLDILVNKEEVDALSFIIHADTAYERARKMCEKLKEEIPRSFPLLSPFRKARKRLKKSRAQSVPSWELSPSLVAHTAKRPSPKLSCCGMMW